MNEPDGKSRQGKETDPYYASYPTGTSPYYTSACSVDQSRGTPYNALADWPNRSWKHHQWENPRPEQARSQTNTQREGREEGGGEGERRPASEAADEEGGIGSCAVGRAEPEGRDLRRPPQEHFFKNTSHCATDQTNVSHVR